MISVLRWASALEADLPAMLAMTEQAVNVDSGSYSPSGVNAVIDLWAGMLSDIGFGIERTPLPGFGDQLTARLSLGGNGSRLLVLGHADTVWPAGIAAEWPFRRDGDRITGPGVGDMKTNVVMALYAIRALLRDGAASGLASMTVCIVPDEEIGSPGSRAWLEAEAAQADFCLTLEPCRPGGGLVIGRGAVGALYVTATGVTAHCGAARDQGASAVSALADLVKPLEALGDVPSGVYATVGILRGGDARQVVPGWAEMHLDLRASDDALAARLLADVRRTIQERQVDPRVRLELRGGFTRPAFPTLPGTEALYGLAETFGAELGVPVTRVVARGGSDGSFAARLGVPTLDGLGAVAHETCSRREWVEVSSIVPRGAILAGLVQAIAEGIVQSK